MHRSTEILTDYKSGNNAVPGLFSLPRSTWSDNSRAVEYSIVVLTKQVCHHNPRERQGGSTDRYSSGHPRMHKCMCCDSFPVAVILFTSVDFLLV